MELPSDSSGECLTPDFLLFTDSVIFMSVIWSGDKTKINAETADDDALRFLVSTSKSC